MQSLVDLKFAPLFRVRTTSAKLKNPTRRQAVALAVGLALSTIVSTFGYHRFGLGTNAAFVPSIVVLLGLFAGKVSWAREWDRLGPLKRATFFFTFAILLFSQIIDPYAWVAHRDAFALLGITLLAFTITKIEVIFFPSASLQLFFHCPIFWITPVLSCTFHL